VIRKTDVDGDALDLSEFEKFEVSLGEIIIIPLGISHSVISIRPKTRSSYESTSTAKSVGASLLTRPGIISTAGSRSRRPCTNRPNGGTILRRRGESR